MYENYYGYENEPENNKINESPAHNTNYMAIASLVLGVIAFLSISMVLPAIVLGCLGTIMALLSRSSDAKMTGMAKGGIITSLVAVILSLAIMVITIVMIFSNPSFVKMYQEMQQDMYDYYYNDGEYPSPEKYIEEYVNQEH